MESERRIEKEREELTFEAAAAEWYTQNKGGWANQKHVDQVINTLRDYAFPVFGSVPVSEVSIEDVISCLKPIWDTKTETAKRVRQRIERVLSYAKTIITGLPQTPPYGRVILTSVPLAQQAQVTKGWNLAKMDITLH